VNLKDPASRHTVHLAEVIWRKAGECMTRKGFNGNFSAYVADLIRRDHEATPPPPPPLSPTAPPKKPR
jgi:hypothetical protein